MKKYPLLLPTPAPALPITVRTPAITEACAPSNVAQAAFRQALLRLEGLRAQLLELQEIQASARQRYWQAVGPAAAAVVAARHALYAPLEEALLISYFSRLEEQQIVQFIVGNAQSLVKRFGEDEAAMLAKYAPPPAAPPPAAADALPPLTPQEQAAHARQHARAYRVAEAMNLAALADQQRLQTSAKTVYRQLARAHHPDLVRDPAVQVEKTALMQQITAAYEAHDLFALLQLLADSAPATDAEADVLIQYTQALHRQQIDLKNQLQALQYGPQRVGSSTGKKQTAELRQLKRDLRAEADYVRQVAHQIQDPAGLRALLRELTDAGLDSV